MQVMLGYAPFSGVVETPRQHRSLVERFDGWTAERSEAHARDVDHRRRPVHLAPAAVLTQHLGRENLVVRVEARIRFTWGIERERLVFDDQVVARRLHLVVRAKPEIGVLKLGRGVDPPTFVTTERTFLVVVGDDVLAELGPTASSRYRK